MDRSTFIETERLAICPVEEDDLERLKDILNLPEVRIPVDQYEPLSMADEQDWFDEQCQSDDVHLTLVHREDERVIGTVGLEFIDERSHLGELGYFLDPAYHSRGLGTEAVEAVVSYGFNELNLHRIEARVMAQNEKSAGLLRKLGFTKEAELRDHVYADGAYRDTLKFGLLEDEWPPAERQT